MGMPATTNPLLILFINMTVVFSVLVGLSFVIRLIKVLDPTQKKNVAKDEVKAVAATAPAAPAATVQNDAQIVAVIAAAIAAYGYSESNIASIRRVDGKGWTQAGRLAAVNTRTQMY